ncbi:hypothetical protein [Nocardioides ferulae]|uniref:hypothetical protein n=1 Tax=Nocardioides ferulae TaxID=2340821 RepID=UPI000EB5688B|nr:hypothetical protein [Nocardioides ferulae]
MTLTVADRLAPAVRSTLPSPDSPTSGHTAPTGAGEPLLALAPVRLAGLGRRLTSAAEDVREQPPPEPPDTGPTSEATARHLDRLHERTDGIAGEVQTLSETLDRVVELLRDVDDTVAAALTRVRAGASR